MKYFTLLLTIAIFFFVFSLGHSISQPIPDEVVADISNYLQQETGEEFTFYVKRVNSRVESSRFNDPYDTLGSSIVFAATAKEREGMKPFGLTGLYDKGEVIWYSERIEFPYFQTSGHISRIDDITYDGNVEIMSDWSHRVDGVFGRRYGWIHSWNGTAAERINELDEDRYSTLISHESGEFSLTDLNGDGVLEIYSSVPETDIPIESYAYHYYRWDGSIYRKMEDEPSLDELKFVPKDRLEAKVRFSFESDNGTVEYRYQIKNHEYSIQEVESFLLDRIPSKNLKSVNKGGWFFSGVSGTNLILWEATGEVPDYVKQNESSSIFSFKSEGLPDIKKYYTRGANRSPKLYLISLEEEIEDLYVNSYTGYTLGPSDPPEPFDASAFTDTLLSYTDRACELEWITNQGICRSLRAPLQNTKRQLERGNTRTVANTVQAFLNEVEAARRNHLTSEGYALLWFNGEYLLERLEKE